jgi:hypothetical protein
LIGIKLLLDDPYKFFRKNKPRIAETLAYAALISAVFAALNEVSIYFGFNPATLVYGHFETAFIIFASLFAGFLIVAIPFALISQKKVNSKTYQKSLFVLVHAATPFMLFGWIPHAAIKVILLAWTFAFLAIGIHIQMKRTSRDSLLITLAIYIIIAVISVFSQNYVLAPV